MADGGVDIDLYADDIESDFNRQDEFGGDNVDLYDDVLAAPPAKPEDVDGPRNPSSQQHSHPPEETNGNAPYHNSAPNHHHGRRFQLYVGNLTWWATDQDIANAVADIGVNDFQDVKFFENRANGQSKGFCVISLGSDQSIRMVMDRLPKKEIHGQHPVVTLPTKQALNQFESQSKTRSTPPGPNNPGMRGPHPSGPPGPHPGGRASDAACRRASRRSFHFTPVFCVVVQPPGQGLPPPHHQLPPHQAGPPRGPTPLPQHPDGFPVGVGPGAPAPHVNPAFFSQQPPGQPAPGVQPPPQPTVPGPGAPYGHPPHGAPPPNQGPPLPGARTPYGRPPQSYGGGGEPRGGHHVAPLAHPHAHPHPQPVISEAEFEEVMGRNRTVSSSAIARAVSDAAAGEYASAIETLVTAISLIKQSKVAHDDRCKILISSLQDTLHGVETKSYGGERRRSRSRERDARAHHRAPRRRDRSASRYRDRSRDREDRDSRYYRDYRERERERSRSRDRERADHYNRGHSREERARKSPVEPTAESGAGDATGAKSRSAGAPYYDERYRERRERDPAPAERDRERERDHRRDARH
ncbi:Cleavage and polyadenylation specificity factor subunit 7 [Papilio machaon]|uniref:Cleavage and polyadenylation specificity factor subunit 6 n=1 Tax=Papilio machaon TaxID=76193 RepID=A0A0N0PCT6_PAPMA|nr:Cleavage and polyadenylation specificity factor subunit 7 [Papilio machaon]